ncbi:MAG: imidazolonepropionase-like amidohydrolase [Saprospiraceae bacterium]|jgi:imidazolonepropionase-like amidohydrolase
MNKTKQQLSFLTLFCVLFTFSLTAQITFPQNGVYDERDGLYAFINATIYKSYNEKIEEATLIIKNGKIVAIGTRIPIPEGALVTDLKGKFIYPGFIDMYAAYGIPEIKRERGGGGFSRSQQMLSKKEGAYSWNQALKPEFRAHENFKADDKAAKDYRNNGFTAVMTHQEDGLSRGTSTLVTLGEGREHKALLKEKVAHVLSFKKGTSSQSYPGSLMGGISLFRQTYLDAQWYKDYGSKEEKNISLEAWNEISGLPQVFDVRDKLEVLRAAKMGKEFGVSYIFKGNGDEYQRLDEIKATGSKFILPLNFPDAIDVQDPYDALAVSLGDMKHWELAPSNPARLANAGIEFVLTTNGLKSKADFWKNIKTAIEQGLTEDQALKAITHTPAKLMGVYDIIGSLDAGKLANFVIASENIFNEKAKIHQNWIRGKAFIIKDLEEPNLDGTYELKVGGQTFKLIVKDKMEIEVNDSTKISVKHKYSKGLITLSFPPHKEETKILRLSGTVIENDKLWSGNATLIDGTWVSWTANYQGETPKDEKKDGKKNDRKEKKGKEGKEDKKENDEDEKLGEILYPFMAHGWSEKPTKNTYLIRNATVWTNEKDGILKNTDVLIVDGKISSVGTNLKSKSGKVIDGTSMHLTPGIIDEHSHIAISRGVNECTQESTAEVSIRDVVNSEDINIYRQLAGGVTTAHLLHGSCNPIGGQSALIKLRWGSAPEEMKFKDAPGFIKFALGENVKRSSSSSNNRFPNTRMGVEQVYRDYFTRAKEYLANKGKPGTRRDLDLETLGEILNNERHITCHSYVQSEINMLMHVADDMGFKINTFTHILEGYKVADKMAKHGAAGSSFADWWAYKYEVIHAIPYNGAIMHREGVLTGFNSDDAEMARRLNQEAAKAVKYGGVSEEEALKFVTLNPAKMLHVDDKVGSIKVGKDADIVLWTDNPLSVYAKAQMTFVDGIKLFDREEDLKIREEIKAERARLIQKMLVVKKEGGKTGPPKGRRMHNYHCDDMEDEMQD